MITSPPLPEVGLQTGHNIEKGTSNHASDKEMPNHEENPKNLEDLDSIPLSELLKNPDEVLSIVSMGADPLLITQNGKPTCALVSLYDLSQITGAVNNPLLETSRFEESSPSEVSESNIPSHSSFDAIVADLESGFAHKLWSFSDVREHPDSSWEQDPETVFPNLVEFVHSWLLQVINRTIDDQNTFWCSEWWKHPEAVCRLATLWRSWEEERCNMSTFTNWWHDRLDYHMSVLMSPTGPFRYCSDGFHDSASYARDAFPIKEPPAGLFDMLG